LSDPQSTYIHNQQVVLVIVIVFWTLLNLWEYFVISNLDYINTIPIKGRNINQYSKEISYFSLILQRRELLWKKKIQSTNISQFYNFNTLWNVLQCKKKLLIKKSIKLLHVYIKPNIFFIWKKMIVEPFATWMGKHKLITGTSQTITFYFLHTTSI
jgi:hypothetical protein